MGKKTVNCYAFGCTDRISCEMCKRSQFPTIKRQNNEDVLRRETWGQHWPTHQKTLLMITIKDHHY